MPYPGHFSVEINTDATQHQDQSLARQAVPGQSADIDLDQCDFAKSFRCVGMTEHVCQEADLMHVAVYRDHVRVSWPATSRSAR